MFKKISIDQKQRRRGEAGDAAAVNDWAVDGGIRQGCWSADGKSAAVRLSATHLVRAQGMETTCNQESLSAQLSSAADTGKSSMNAAEATDAMGAMGAESAPVGPLVSILIPCHNGAGFVAEAIDSALGQTYSNIEVIVVDDGSTDSSGEILAGYGERIRWKTIPNSGACAARNEALRMAKGEYIQFLDADDLLMPDKIARQLPELVDGEFDLVFCRGTIFGDGKPERAKKNRILSPVGVDSFAYCLKQGLGMHAPLHRRELLDQVGGFRPGVQMAQEYDLHLRLAAAGARIAFQDALLCRVRHHPGGERISRLARPAGAFLRVLLDLTHELMRRPHYQMTAIRRRALANLLAQHAVYACRNGSRRLPVHAFRLARRLDPCFSIEERSWYRTIARGLGYMNVERFLAALRRLRAASHPHPRSQSGYAAS